MLTRGPGEILHIELGMKAQNTVRDIWIERGDKAGYFTDLPFIDISGDKES
jgi:hypothetical protein